MTRWVEECAVCGNLRRADREDHPACEEADWGPSALDAGLVLGEEELAG